MANVHGNYKTQLIVKFETRVSTSYVQYSFDLLRSASFSLKGKDSFLR